MSGSSPPPTNRSLLRFSPLWLVTACLAYATLRTLVSKVGGPGAPLDDSYIHLQYARAIAEGHPFRYTAGAAPTPGATSLLWPLVLAPFHVLGLHEDRLLYATWLLGFVSLGLLSLEVTRLANGLVRRSAAIGAGAMTLAFGGYTWFAASGMEVVPFAWALTLATRRAAEWAEAPEPASRREAVELVCLSALCPALRPEGAVVSAVIAAVIAWFPRGRRPFAALALLSPALPPLVSLLATGQAVPSTAFAKWLVLNPYYGNGLFAAAVRDNVRLFFDTLLDGKSWTSVFLPSGGRLPLALGIPAIMVAGSRRGRIPRALVTTALALAILCPTTYETFLVNRVRYIWPFFGAWFIGLAALADSLGEAIDAGLEKVGARPLDTPAWACFGVVGLLASKLPYTMEDLGDSARAVSLQQVSLARWAKTALPPEARVGVNDTGAMAYLGGHRTFDVVGLTTFGEARYWIAGAGSRFEHYERLDRSLLPTHFVVYPGWFSLDPLLGEELTSRTVSHTILGGTTMEAHVADYSLLRSAETPVDVVTSGRKVADVLDVADLESEAAHDYRLLDATQARDVLVEELDHADGARTERTREHFRLRLVPGGFVVARVGAKTPTRIAFFRDGRLLGRADVEEDAWEELRLDVPRTVPDGTATVDVVAEGAAFDALHYWSYE
ncbi:MAG TPA: hypothetical protein VHE30_22905 [Polyangiaceae bacterium]|nr:hypothetical protein [Polyangiaceae bacterium]